MSLLEGFFEFMTNSLPGGIIDNVMGRGYDGDRFSSFENYVRPDSNAQNPNITINADTMSVNAREISVTESAPVQEAAPVEVSQQSAEEIAFNQAMAQARQDQEQYQGHRL